MSQRVYLPARLLDDAAGQSIALDKARSHYLSNVLRLKPGATIRCFDGAGVEWRAQIARSGRQTTLEIDSIVRRESAPGGPIDLGVAWLKGAAMDTVMQKATELGASHIVVLRTERTNVHLESKRLENKLRHWRQIIISAAEQSGRLHLPTLAGPTTLVDATADTATRRILLDPGARLLDAGLQPQPVTLLVGPEGGWTDAERSWARHNNVEIAGLGPLTMRAETAPLAALAVVRHSWGWR